MPKKKDAKLTKLKSWEEYMRESGKYDPKGNEAFYFAQKLIGYRYKNAQPPVPFDQEKADKEAKKMAETPYFKEQFEKNKESISKMMEKEQYDKIIEKIAPPLPSKRENLNEAYKGLEDVHKKMSDGSYGIKPTEEWKELQNSIGNITDAYKKDPQMNDIKMMSGLANVYMSFRKNFTKTGGMRGPEGEKMMNFSMDFLTAVGGGPKVVSKNFNELLEKTYKEMSDMTKEIENEMKMRSDNFHKKMGWTSQPQKKDGPENKQNLGQIEPKKVSDPNGPVLKGPEHP